MTSDLGQANPGPRFLIYDLLATSIFSLPGPRRKSQYCLDQAIERGQPLCTLECILNYLEKTAQAEGRHEQYLQLRARLTELKVEVVPWSRRLGDHSLLESIQDMTAAYVYSEKSVLLLHEDLVIRWEGVNWVKKLGFSTQIEVIDVPVEALRSEQPPAEPSAQVESPTPVTGPTPSSVSSGTVRVMTAPPLPLGVNYLVNVVSSFALPYGNPPTRNVIPLLPGSSAAFSSWVGNVSELAPLSLPVLDYSQGGGVAIAINPPEPATDFSTDLAVAQPEKLFRLLAERSLESVVQPFSQTSNLKATPEITTLIEGAKIGQPQVRVDLSVLAQVDIVSQQFDGSLPSPPDTASPSSSTEGSTPIADNSGELINNERLDSTNVIADPSVKGQKGGTLITPINPVQPNPTDDSSTVKKDPSLPVSIEPKVEQITIDANKYGGQNYISINGGNQSIEVTIDNFLGVGQGINPPQALWSQIDTLKFSGAGLTAENLLLTQQGADLLLTFEGNDLLKVWLKNVPLDTLDNLIPETGGVTQIGNILFNGETSIQDNFDIIDANVVFVQIQRAKTVVFLNDLNNTAHAHESGSVINGQGGNDILIGSSGNDILRGGTGNDILIGGGGNNRLVGGTGSDIFGLSNGGFSQVTDFNTNEDFIGLTEDLTYAQLRFEAMPPTNGSGTRIYNQRTNELLMELPNVAPSALTSNLFLSLSPTYLPPASSPWKFA